MPGAEADLAQHLHVVLRALAQAVRLEQLALRLQHRAALVELAPDLGHRLLEPPLLDVVVRRRPDRDVLEVVLDQLARQRVEVLQPLDLVAEQHRPERRLLVGGEDLQRVAAHAERAAAERLVVAVVLERDELAQQLVAVDEAALDQHLAVRVVGLGRAEAEDARHRGDDHHVAAREQRRRRGVAQPVDLLVDRRVLLDVEVARRDVGLGLVVVVVGDEVLDRVVREVRPELVAELRRERLVVRDHQRRPLQLLDRRGHRHRLARAGGAEQRHAARARLDRLGDAVDRRRLIGGRRVDGVELERRHGRRTVWEHAGRNACAFCLGRFRIGPRHEADRGGGEGRRGAAVAGRRGGGPGGARSARTSRWSASTGSSWRRSRRSRAPSSPRARGGGRRGSPADRRARASTPSAEHRAGPVVRGDPRVRRGAGGRPDRRRRDDPRAGRPARARHRHRPAWSSARAARCSSSPRPHPQ